MTETARVFNNEDTPEDKPLLLLDVDGVINVFNGSQRGYIMHRATVGHGTFPLKIRTEMSVWLEKLSEHFHLVWCTMWNDEANTHIGPVVGLPVLPYVPVYGRYRGAVYAESDRLLHPKVHAIKEHVPGRAFAWVDDEISRRDLLWAENRSKAFAPTHLEKTDERQGLIDHQVKRLVTWAMSLKEKSEA